MDKYVDKLEARTKQLRERGEDLEDQRETFIREVNRLKQERERIQVQLRAATEDDADRPTQEVETISQETAALAEQVHSYEKELAEVEQELSEQGALLKKDAEQFRTPNLEGQKLLFEVFKLVATLGTGSIVAIAAVAAAIVSDPERVWMLYASFVLLLTSITWSVTACLITTQEIWSWLTPLGPAEREQFWSPTLVISVVLSLGGLFFGIIFAIWFLTYNT